MEIRVLKYFLAIAETNSFTGASKLLHITQPTLTRQIKELEKSLGQKLFNRTNHSVSLTTEGIIFRQRAQEIIDMVEKTQNEFNSMNKIISGEIFIGSGETYSMKIIAKIIKELQISYPQIKFHLYSGNAEDITEKIEKGLLDFGLLIQPTDISKYNYLTLPTKDTWGLITTKENELAKLDKITLDNLKNVPLIVSKQAHKRKVVNNDYKNWFKDKFDKLNVVATYNLIYNAGIMVNEGICSAIGLKHLIDTTNNTNLCFIPFYPTLESKIDIIWKKNQKFSPAAKLFLTELTRLKESVQ